MEWVEKNNEWKPLVQSYLACVSFADHQVGKLLDALDNSPDKDNTYIVLYTDHGFHQGEKERLAKRSLWEDGTRAPAHHCRARVLPKGRSAQSRHSCWMSIPHCWN